MLKDAMRELSVKSLVESWYNILREYSGKNGSKVECLCLNVIGAYISWIDVTLIANNRFIDLIIGSLARSDSAEAATDCICSLLSKGMPPTNKVTDILSLNNSNSFT